MTPHRGGPGLVAAALHGEGSSATGATAADVLDGVWARVSDPIALVTSLRGPEGPRIAAANPSFSRLFAQSADELRGQPLARVLGLGADGDFVARVRSRVFGKGETLSDVSVVRRTSRGPMLIEWELAPIQSGVQTAGILVAMLRDATPSVGRSSHRGSDIDPLTGLPSQAHFMSRLERSVERAAQAPTHAIAVLGFEVDDLRAIERRLGALISNTALEALAWRIRQRLRRGDLIARTGERTLAVLLDSFAPWGVVEEVFDRVEEATREPYTIGGERIALNVVGVACSLWTRDRLPETAEEVMDEVALALTRARGEGVARERSRASRLGRRPSGIARTVGSGELDLRYLPVVDVQTSRPVGLEALVRWRHTERGTLAGSEFLEEAEASGLILPIGRWV
ncbi:MAG TPA: diguanylate cyclase, partial [Candidatus Thermoplasmatota archaeon]